MDKVELSGVSSGNHASRWAAPCDAIAVELGSSREVISRLLKSLERKGYIALGRGIIRVDDRAALQAVVKKT